MKTRRLKLSFNSVHTVPASLALNNVGISIPLDRKSDSKKTLEQFGFFGSSSDSNKFYPDLDVPNSVQPKDEDFIRVPFRLLSATIVGAGSWKATDFSDESMLRSSLGDLAKKPVYLDHDTDMHNWVGMVDSTVWGPREGDVPGGINGVISIDAVVAPKVARGVLQGIIFSNSVTVEFDWKPSHEFTETYEFENRIGQMHEDGTMIRRIATTIHNYHESSLVWLGADPYAKLIDTDGNLVHIDKSSVQLSKDDTDKERENFNNNKTYSIGFSMPKQVLGLSKKRGFNSNSNNSKDMNKEQLEFLRNLLGLSADAEISTEQLQKLGLKSAVTAITAEQTAKLEKFDKLNFIDVEGTALPEEETTGDIVNFVVVKKESFDTLAGDAKQLKLDKDALDIKVTNLTANAEVGQGFLKLKRSEVKRLYAIFVENKTDASVVSLIDSCTPDQLDGMLAQYTKGAENKFSITIKNAETGEFEFRSSLSGNPGLVDTDDVIDEGIVSYQDLHAKYSNSSMTLSGNKNN